MDHEQAILIDPRRVGLVLFCTAIGLLVAHVTAMLIWFHDLLPLHEWWQIGLFDLDEEESIGTWFSSIILLIAGLLLLLIARTERRSEGAMWLWWLVLAVGFHVLSLDEVAGFHEYVNMLAGQESWTSYFAPLVLVVGLFYIPFLKALPARTRWLFVLSGMMYVGGAIGVERATDWYDEQDLLNTLAYNLWTAVEEGLEMLGVILFIYALLDYLSSRNDIILNLTFSSK